MNLIVIDLLVIYFDCMLKECIDNETVCACVNFA